MKCVFCDIAAKKEKARVVFEDAEILAFLDNFPVSKGHTLIIPKEHYANILDIPQDTLKHITEKAKDLALKYKSSLGATGFNIFQSSGQHAGQSVLHYHMHLVPRYQDDGLKLWLHGDERKNHDTELDVTFKKIIKG